MSLKSIFFLGFLATTLFAQSKSAVQFYDTTGATKTGKIGWTGDAVTGHVFIQTPQDGEVIKTVPGTGVQVTGGVAASGSVTATKFIGDGSNLTNLPASSSPTVGSVTGLQDSLNKKANGADLTTLQGQVGAKADSNWVNGKLGIKADTTMLKKKADTSWVLTKIGSSGGGTITGVSAGSGLTGGGTTGTVTLSIANGTIPATLPPSGTAGGSLSGTYPNPGIAAGAISDANVSSVSATKITGLSDSLKKKADTGWVNSKIGSMGGGTITGVTAGSGLTGGGTTGTITLSIANGTIPTTLPPNGSAGGALTGQYPNPGIASGAVADANISSVSATKVTGLPDSLRKKADTGWVNSNFYTQGQVNSLIGGGKSTGWINLAGSGFVLNGVTLYGTLITSSSSSLGSITLTAPTAGFALVWANAAIQPGDNTYTDVSIALSSTASSTTSSLSTCRAAFQWQANNLEVTNSISTCNMFPVSAGSNTFYLNASSGTGNPVAKGVNLMAIFVKTQL